MQSVSGNSGSTARICAIIVTFHPSPALLDNVERLKPQVSEIVIVDNGSDEPSAALLRELEKQSGVRVIHNGKNLGIAAALNIGIRHATAENYPWVLTFDQDSIVTPDFVANMLAAYEADEAKEKIALVSPVHCHLEAEAKSGSASGKISSSIPVAMTSGSLIKTRVLMENGSYDEPMFIDYVDFDFCLRVRRRGWGLIRAERAFLLHQLGSRDTHSVAGVQLSLTSHNATRCYYIMRNRVAMYRRYAFSFPLWVAHDLKWMMIDLAKIIFFEPDKAAKLSKTFKGIRHALAGISGPLKPPA